MNNILEYIPIITTMFSLFFYIEIYKHYKHRKTQYLFWWSIGVLTFGLGTLTESINVLFGYHALNLKLWYIVGALLGGFPLAQGTVYLIMGKKFAKRSTILIVSLIGIASFFILLTPVILPNHFNSKLTGSVFAWQWVRLFSPLINLYAFIFLVGGAIVSALRYKRMKHMAVRYKGNIYIAIGGLLPGIGGSFTRMGYVNVLFVTELLGLLLIYYGYLLIKTNKRSIKDTKIA